MFEQSFLSNGKTRRPWTVLVAFAAELVAIGGLLVGPLLFIDSPPVKQLTAMLLVAPPAPPPPPPPAPPAQARLPRKTRATPRKFDANQLIAPRTIPKQVATIKDSEVMAPPSEAIGVIGGVPGGVPGGVMGGVIGGVLSAAAPPPPLSPPPKAEVPKPPERIITGGNVQAALLIHEVRPQYPLVARQARIVGVVRLKAIIGRDGTVQNLVLVSGHPLLVQAAMDAVKLWVYKPTYLNGVAVEVLTEVSVNFHLT